MNALTAAMWQIGLVSYLDRPRTHFHVGVYLGSGGTLLTFPKR